MNEYENDDRIYCISLVDDIVVDWYRLVNNLVKRNFEMEEKEETMWFTCMPIWI